MSRLYLMENTGGAKKIGNILPGYAEIPVIC